MKYDFGVIRDIILDDVNDLLFVSTETNGGIIYNTKTNEISIIQSSKDMNVADIALDIKRNRIVGAICIRHYLTEALLNSGGHIGDGIRPSERRKGYEPPAGRTAEEAGRAVCGFLSAPRHEQ